PGKLTLAPGLPSASGVYSRSEILEKKGSEMLFKDRHEAGEALARALEGLQHDEVVVYALPRGGVPLGIEVAQAIEAPLDLLIVRKLGNSGPGGRSPGVVTEDGNLVIDPEAKRSVDPDWLGKEVERLSREA